MNIFAIGKNWVQQTLLVFALLLGLLPHAGAATNCAAVTDISQAECETLVALYNSTNDTNWTRNDGWNVTNTPCSWYGVTCLEGKLVYLKLGENNLTGSLPDLSALTTLTVLQVHKNGLTGVIPDLSSLTQLLWLYLQYNQLTGTIPAGISSLTRLQRLYLNDNHLSGSIPDLSQLTGLQYLALSTNNLSGPIPDLSQLTRLQYLALNNNNLKGAIPDLSTLTNLQQLYLHENQLTGIIPDSMSQLVKLQQLYLSKNQLTGSIPELAPLVNLQRLYLQYNQLEGTIPNLTPLSKLQRLYINDNELSGPIPALDSLVNLEYLTLTNNPQLCRNPNANYAGWQQVNEFSLCVGNYTLTVQKNGTGTGNVTGQRIDCGNDCTETYGENTQISLTVTADPQSTFAGWSGACSGMTNCQVTMNNNKTVTATFNRCDYQIDPTQRQHEADADSGRVNLAAAVGCSWTAHSNDSWLTLTSDHNGRGNGTVNYSVAANNEQDSRSGSLAIAGQTFSVSQKGKIIVGPGGKHINIFPSLHDFGIVDIGTSSPSQRFTISNSGNMGLQIGVIRLTGANASEFAQNNSCSNKTIPPTGSCTLDANFSPDSEGEKTAQLEIPSDDSDIPVLRVSLTGISGIPNIDISPTSPDFGKVKLETTSSSQQFTISNVGNAVLNLSAISLIGTNAAEFSIDPNTCSSNQALASQETCTLEVVFSPTSLGDKTAEIEILSNDPDTPTLTVNLTGKGVIWFIKTEGGNDLDIANAVQATSDGGYIIAGETNSYGQGGDVFVAKFDKLGQREWYKHAGGNGGEGANSIQETADGGYIVAGSTSSCGTDNSSDVFLLKYDMLGKLLWAKSVGGWGPDIANSVQQTIDGGYIVAGVSESFTASLDMFLVKFDHLGEVQWAKAIGKSSRGHEEAHSVQQTTDGGYIVAGRTTGYGAGGNDVFLLKLNRSGDIEWARTLGENLVNKYNETAYSVQQTTDGGYVIAGRNDVFGSTRALVAKYDTSGNLEWARSLFGDINNDRAEARSVYQTTDGGYIIAGRTDKGVGTDLDAFLIKLTNSGEIEWAKTVGGNGDDRAHSVMQTVDSGYIAAGQTNSQGAGASDIFLFKTDENGNTENTAQLSSLSFEPMMFYLESPKKFKHSSASPDEFPQNLKSKDCEAEKLSSLSGTVTDKNSGQPLAGVTVTIAGEQYIVTTDNNGYYTIPNIVVGTYNATIRKEEYPTVNCQSDSYCEPVKVNTNPTDRDFVLSKGFQVLSIKSQYPDDAFYLAGVNHDVSFESQVEWDGNEPGYVIFGTFKDESEVITTGTTASKTFNMKDEFGTGASAGSNACHGGLGVYAITKDYEKFSEEKRADFTIMSYNSFRSLAPAIKQGYNRVEEGKEFYYKSSLAANFKQLELFLEYLNIRPINIPDSIPFFGGRQIGANLVPKVTSLIKSNGAIIYDLDWENAPIHKGELTQQSGFVGQLAGFEYKLTPKLRIQGQFSKTSCEWQEFEGSFGIAGKLKKETKPRRLPPIVRTMGGPLGGVIASSIFYKASVDISADGLFRFESFEPLTANGKFKIEPMLKGTIGAGVNDVAAIEGWISGGADIRFQLVDENSPDEESLEKLQLLVKGGMQIYVLVFKWESEFFKWEWNLVDTKRSRTLRSYPINSSVEAKLLSRDYLNNPNYGTFWKTARSVRSSHSSVITPLQTTIFEHSEAYVSSNNNKLYAIWLFDASARNSINRTMAVFSAWNGTDWNDPKPIADDGTADFSPKVLAFADDSALATWEDVKVVMKDTGTFEEMVQNMEVSVSQYQPDTKQWVETQRLTNNAYLDRSPKLAGTTNNTMVIWISNRANDIVGSSAKPNQLWYSLWTTNGWSLPQRIADIPYGIIKYSVAYDGKHGTLVMSLDTDGDLGTIADRELFQITFTNGVWGSLNRLTNDSVVDDNPQLAIAPNGDIVLTWLKGGELSSVVNFAMATRTIISTDEYSSNLADFKLASSSDGKRSILWIEPSEYSSDIHGIFYDPVAKVWGEPQPLTSDNEGERRVAVSFYGADTVVALYNRNQIKETPTVETTTQGDTVNISVPEVTNTDLYMLEYTLQPSDLSPAPIVPPEPPGTDTSPTVPETPENGAAIDAQGHLVLTTAYFTHSVTTGNGQSGNGLQLAPTEVVTIASLINVDREHVGQAADLLIVASYIPAGEETPFWYMREGVNWQPWDGNVAQIAPAQTKNSLEDMETVDIYQGNFQGIPGEFTVYVGYRLSTGMIVFNMNEPIQFVVE